MCFVSVTAPGVVGLSNTASTIFISIRKCYKANKKIGGLVDDGVALLKNIEELAVRSSAFLDVGSIDILDFCSIAGKIEKIKVKLEKLKDKLNNKEDRPKNLKTKLKNKIKKIYRFPSSTESVSALEIVYDNLWRIETEMRLMIMIARCDMKASMLLETQDPLLDAAAKMNPDVNDVREKQKLLVKVRQALGTHALRSRIDRCACGNQSMEGNLNLNLGIMYMQGLTVDLDYEKSASFFITAISCGNTEAFAYLGRQHARGLGMPKDLNKAFSCYMDGANVQEPECLFEVGRSYRVGCGIEVNKAKGLEYFRKAATLRHAAAQRLMGHCLQNGIGTKVNFMEGALYYKAAAEAGDVQALVQYAFSMLGGRGVERNELAAVDMFNMAASVGSIDALVYLGHCYYNGRGVEQDFREAFRLFYKAANQNDLRARAKAGYCLLYGKGVVRNETKGIKYIREAATGGNLFAMKVFANLTRNGIGMVVNKSAALTLNHRIANRGLWYANLHLAEMYRDGEGVEVSLSKAIHHFTIYARYGEHIGHWNLALIYNSEEGFVDENRAFYHLSQAAELGNVEAQKILGESVVKGRPPEQMSFTSDQIGQFLLKMKKKYLQRKNNTQNIFAPRGSAPTPTMDSTVPDFINGQHAPVPEPENNDIHADYAELKELKKVSICKSTVSELSRLELAALLAAYLVGYETRMEELFSEMKPCILQYLEDNLVSGDVLVHDEEKNVQEIIHEITHAVCENNVGGGSDAVKRRSIRLHLSSFMKRIRTNNFGTRQNPSISRTTFTRTETELAPPQAEEEVEDFSAQRNELRKLKEMDLNVFTVLNLPGEKLAATIAAYLVSYEPRMTRVFSKIKLCVLKFVQENRVTGDVLLHGKEEDVQEIIDGMIDAVCKNGGEGSSADMRRSVRNLWLFMKHIRNRAGETLGVTNLSDTYTS